MRRILFLVITLAFGYSLVFANQIEPQSTGSNLFRLLNSTSAITSLQGDFSSLTTSVSEDFSGSFTTVTLPDEPTTIFPGKPVLPVITRFVIVPPDANVELAVDYSEPRREHSDNPLLFDAEPGFSVDIGDEDGVFPPKIVEMGEPFIIRGVRMVKLTTYPVRYDFKSNDFLIYDHLHVEVRTAVGLPVNPVVFGEGRKESPSFRKFLEAIAVNGGEALRDDPLRDDAGAQPGHYLIVVEQNCLPYIRPFIEWKRQSGYKVDILYVPWQDARDPSAVKESIQDRYDAYLEQGVDPFDFILLVGDRESYYSEPDPGWVLNSFEGTTGWVGADHSDYHFALLEGEDDYPDVGISRWVSGSEATLELAVGRTLAYEAKPYMDDPDWFNRAPAYSQHWGNSAESEWHPTVHLSARWGVEVLRQKGFVDVPYYELFDWDQQGQQIGPWMRDRLNEGASIMVGRAQNWYFRNEFQGVNENVVFPINITSANHSDMVSTTMFRQGDGDNLKGLVAASFTWGELGMTNSIYPCNAIWSEMVRGVLIEDLPMGWARIYALTAFERHIPNIEVFGQDIYPMIRTDFDVIGDPGIQPWIGTPRIANAELTTRPDPTRQSFEVVVTDVAGNPVPGATVTFYAAGEIPEDPEEFAQYDGYVIRSAISDDDGFARFVFGEDTEFEDGTPLFISVTGRAICPVIEEGFFSFSDLALEVTEFEIREVEGNGDGIPNPGETLDIAITTGNYWEQPVHNVTGIVTSLSPYVEVIGDNELDFGDIASESDVQAENAIRIVIANACPDGGVYPGARPLLQIDFQADGGETRSFIEIDPEAPAFKLRSVVGGIIIPADVHDLDLEIQNIGRMNAPSLTATLRSMGMGISVVSAESSFPAVPVAASRRLNDDLFTISGSHVVPPGSRWNMELCLVAENGWRDTIRFELQVGVQRENAPMVPDAYGYICYDDTDDEWDMAPDYEWIEINPNDQNAEFDGERLDFTGDSPYSIGEAIVVELPFETQFYGESFDHITVTSNGFITPGEQPDVVNFQNFQLDRGIGGGAGMIAPFWTDLRMNDNSRILVYYDENEARFIIEWYRMRYARGPDVDLTFQVVLYDHDVWITESGDQDILFQYRTAELGVNIRNGDRVWETAVSYPTVGISSPDGTTGISYTWNNSYPITNAPIEDRRAIKFSTTYRYRTSGIYGWVTDAETGEPIEGVWVFTAHGFFTTTDEEGYYNLSNVLAEVITPLTFRRQGYNDTTVVIEPGIEEGDSVEVSVAMLHPEFLLDPQEVEANLGFNEQAQIDLSLSNDGNGPLDWRAEKRLLGDYNAPPWELRRSYPVTQITGDDRIEGVAFDGNIFYLSGANGNDSNIVYLMDREGELVDSIYQVGSSRYGYRDLEWDSDERLIWATGEDSIYGLTSDGEVVYSWLDPHNPSNYIAIDQDEGVLYVCGTTTSYIIRCDREGNQLGGDLSRQNLRIYGLAWWRDDPDGYKLYIVNRPGDGGTFVTKMNTETGDTITVFQFEDEEGSTGQQGAFITRLFDIYSWVMMSIQNISNANGGDQLQIHQLDARTEWFELDRYQGRLEADGNQELILTLDATDLPDTLFESEILFTHNADSGYFSLYIQLDVRPVSVIDDPLSPYTFNLTAVYPSPFNSRLTIDYAIDAVEPAKLAVYDLAGREVARLFDGIPQTGRHKSVWDAEQVSSGVYLVRLESAGRVATVKAVLVR